MPLLTFADIKNHGVNGATVLRTAAGDVVIGETGNFTAAEQTSFGAYATLSAATTINDKVAPPQTPFRKLR